MNDETNQAEQAAPPQDNAAPQPPAKKRPGRPKASGNKPKSAANGNAATKKSAGRPKKTAAETTEKPTAAKGRGRPAGSRNANKNPRDNASSSNDDTRNTRQSGNQSGDYAKGLQDLGAGFMAYAQSHMERSVQAAQQLLNCRSLEDIAQVQSQYLQESFDTMVNETNKLAQNAASLAKKTAGPLNAQMEAMMQKFQGRS